MQKETPCLNPFIHLAVYFASSLLLNAREVDNQTTAIGIGNVRYEEIELVFRF